jgi:hypothetical protein
MMGRKLVTVYILRHPSFMYTIEISLNTLTS